MRGIWGFWRIKVNIKRLVRGIDGSRSYRWNLRI